MTVQNKNGKYERFDIAKARWICPKCGTDAMMIETRAFRSPYKFIINHSFKCEKCGFNSLEYGFLLGKKESFNAAHRKLLDIWQYLMIAQKKGWVDGFDAAARLSSRIDTGSPDGNCNR